MSIAERHDLSTAKRRTADAMRTAADEAAAWTAQHQPPPVADRAVARATDWGLDAARRIEDEPKRALAYEARRALRRSPWIVPVTMVTVTALAYGVAAVVTSRRRRAERSQQLDQERTARA